MRIQAADFLALLDHFVVVLVFVELGELLRCPSRHSSKFVGGLAHVVDEPRHELLVEFLGGHAEILLDHVRSGANLREGVDHFEQLVGAPAALDVITDAPRLKIGDDHLAGIVGAHEAAVEFGDRQQLLFVDGDEDVGRDAVAPFGISFRLFVYRESFGEPARHAMIGGSENVDVAHLMPQRAGPVEVAGLAAGRAVHGDHFAESDAQRAQPRHAERADGEILVVGIDFDLHGAGELHFVFLFVGGDRVASGLLRNKGAAGRLRSCGA